MLHAPAQAGHKRGYRENAAAGACEAQDRSGEGIQNQRCQQKSLTVVVTPPAERCGRQQRRLSLTRYGCVEKRAISRTNVRIVILLLAHQFDNAGGGVPDVGQHVGVAQLEYLHRVFASHDLHTGLQRFGDALCDR